MDTRTISLKEGIIGKRYLLMIPTEENTFPFQPKPETFSFKKKDFVNLLSY